MGARAAAVAGLLALAVLTPAAGAHSYIGCGSRDDLTVVLRPARCYLAWPNLSNAAAMYPQHIHWRSWGGQVAPGRALWRYKTTDPWTHLRVWAYARQRCGAGRLYTRVRVKGYVDGRWQLLGRWPTPRCRDVPGLSERLSELEAGH